MLFGAFLVILGIAVLYNPQILIALIAGFLIVAGLSIMLFSWQVRRFHRQVRSGLVSWITRY